MTKAEITKCYKKAKEGYKEEYLNNCECDGIALWDKKKYVTLSGAAALIRWQCIYLNGEWDSEMLSECFELLSKKAILIN